MDGTLVLSDASRSTAGILLLTIVAIEYGGWYVLRLVQGRIPRTEFQTAFARAGHGHAGVLVSLALICQILVDAAGMSGVWEFLAREGVPVAAILIPAGFFLASAHTGATSANRFVVLIYAGMAALAAGLVALGIGLLTA